MKAAPALIVFAALLVPTAGLAAQPSTDEPALRSVGKSFLDYASTKLEEPFHFLPANFPGLVAPPPRSKPEPGAMLLACLGLIVFLGHRRTRALSA